MEDSIAISMLLKACHSLHSLESLVIHFTPVGACHQTVRNQAPRKDPFQDISRMYGPVWFDLQGLLKKSLSLRSVCYAPTCACSVDAYESLLQNLRVRVEECATKRSHITATQSRLLPPLL